AIYRTALAPFFTADAMAAFEPTCRSIAIDHLAQLAAQRDHDFVDFVAMFAEPYSIKCLCAFLGWPLATWERLQGWTHGNQEAAFSRNRAAGAALARLFAQFVDEALQARRGAAPSDDVTSRLMATTVDNRPLTDEDIVSVLRNWAAGHGTVAASLGIVVLHLAESPDLQQRLRGEPALLPTAIDEILRADGPLVANQRTTSRPVEIGGRAIGAEERISLNWIAANRDPRAFAAPERIRLDRDPAANLLFGAGVHFCLGAPLARLELRVAVEELLAREPRFGLRFPEEPGRAVFPSNGLVELPLRLG
ncbi:MAG TPA: cytochrome P450, partial [Thermomicrobiales bacterium]|nr:cytochrome P450 [Thermomicrobiales bacterium]